MTAEHVGLDADANWYPTHWWRAVGPDGRLWAESSNEREIRELARPDDRVERLFEHRQTEWRSVDDGAADA